MEEQLNTPWEKLVDQVQAWGLEKNLNDAAMQFAKINEELGELAHELTRGNCTNETPPSAEAIDAVGDVLVTVLIFARIVGIDPRGALEIAYNAIKNRHGKTINGSFRKDEE